MFNCKNISCSVEIDDKVKRILKLIKEEDLEEQDGLSEENSKKEPLIELIEDLQKQYHSLYGQYDHLKGELRKKVHGKHGKDTSSSSSSDSESDDSSKHKGNKHGRLESEYQKIIDGMKQKLEAANLELAELKSKLTATGEEKDALKLEHQTGLIKIQEEEEIIRNLKLEVERSDTDKAQLLVENGELKQKLDAGGMIEAELNQRLEELNKVKDTLILEKEAATRSIEESEKIAEALKLEYETALIKKQEAEEIIRNLELEVERSDADKAQLLIENGELKQKLDTAGMIEAELYKKLEELNKEKDSLILEKEAAMQSNEESEKITEDLRTLTDWLQEEKSATGQELEALKAELSITKQQLESAEQQVADFIHNLKVTKEENDSLTLKLSKISNDMVQAQNTIDGLIGESGQLKEKLGSREREYLSLAEMHEIHGNKSSDRIKELEVQLRGLELELKSSQAQNRDLEVQIESKMAEAKQLGEQNHGLEARILELEMMSKERGDELSALTKQLEENQNESSRTEILTEQVNTMLAGMESIRAQKEELEEQMVIRGNETSIHVEGLMDQVNVLEQQLEFLHSQKAELGVQLEKKTLEISEYLIQIENLKEEMVSKTADQQRFLAEKESSTAQINDLELEVEALCNQNTELGEQISTEIKERELLGEEMVRLQEKILELEKTRAERDLEFSSLQERQTTGENEASAQIMALTEQVSNLQQGLDSLRTEKNQTQSQFEKEREEFSEKLTELENQKSEFMSQIAEQQRMLDEQEEARKKLNEEHKQVEGWFQVCKVSLEVAERKIEDMAGEFQKNAGSKDQMVEQLEEMIEDLKRDLEVKGDEINTLVENVRNIEVKLRLSNQKLRITEQLLTENEESLRKAEERYQQEKRVLKERAAILSGIITANNEAYHRMVADISQKVNSSLLGLDALTMKFEEDCNRYENCILVVSKEIRIAKNWFMETNNEKEKLRKEVGDLVVQLQDTKERESALKEKVEQLEVKVRMEGAEKENLTKAVNHLEKKAVALENMLKEKDEGISDLGEEKREAIRQLCLWIEYHRSRHDYLREMLSKMPIRSQRAS